MDFNSTLFIQAGIYLCLLLILKKLYFEPLLALIARREAMTLGKAEQTDSLIQKTEELRLAYLHRIQEFRNQLNQERETSLQKLRVEIQDQLELARKKLDEVYAHNQGAFEGEIKSLKEKFPTLSQELSLNIVEMVRSPRISSL